MGSIDLEISKVCHGKFLNAHKGKWFGLGWIYHSREGFTEWRWNMICGSSCEITFRERTGAHPNIVAGTDKSYQDTYRGGILHYSESAREIMDGPIQCIITRKSVLIIQAKFNLLDK